METSYRYENNLRYSAEFEGPFPHIRQTSDIGSGLPAGTFVRDIVDNEGTSVDKIGLSWFKGPDKDLVTDVNVDFTPWGGGRVRYTRRVVTTRPLPAGEYAPNPGGTWHGGVVCARYPAIADNYWVIEITVTAPSGVLHEAFFDPVAIGSAVGADGTNGVLKPADFVLNGTNTTISSLKWESGTATMTLDPSTSLAGHAVDFIALDGSVSLTLSFDDATQSGGTLTWSVASQPWNAGDLLMLRIRSANVMPHRPRPRLHPRPRRRPPLPRPRRHRPRRPLRPTPTPTPMATPTSTATPTPTSTTTTTTTTEPITVTLSPRVAGSSTLVNITIEWSDPEPCDGQYMVALYYTISDYLVRFMGFHPAPATTSLSSELGMRWNFEYFPDYWAGVSCDPSDYSGRRELGRVSLRAAHPDNN